VTRHWRPTPRRRPPWWPEGESWPPTRHWGRRGPPCLLGIGCLFAGAVLLAAVAVLILVGLVAIAPSPLKDSARQTLQGVPAVVTLAVLVVFVVGVAAAARAMRRVTRPMADLVAAAGQIEAGDYSARVAESGPPQLRSVARAFNAMSAKLKSTDERRRSFLAGVTHELRTPLSIIRGQAEGIADGVYPADAAHIEPILDATRGLEVLVEDLRTLVLTDAGSLLLNRELVDLTVLVHDVVASFESQVEAAQINLTADMGDAVPTADLDPARMRSALANVISNAIRHTPAGGSVRVGVRSAGDEVIISVTDTGEGIPKDLMPRVFERFVKAPSSTGSGLGLAIVHDIVSAHGGNVEIESAEGIGTAVRIRLQAAPHMSAS
jgi:two-component system, OmpR family, sensor histidine kinase BaeS